MGLFWNRHAGCDKRLAELETRCEKLELTVRRLRDESTELAERAYRNLKKAEARARRELDESGAAKPQEREPADPATPSGSLPAWGARRRRALRSLRRSDPALELNGETEE